MNVSGQPRPAISWFHNSTELHNAGRLAIETAEGWSYVKIKGATEDDAGLYRVTAENVVGFDSAEFRVIIKGMKLIAHVPDYMRLIVGW